jgi:phospholipase/carboxylesterase
MNRRSFAVLLAATPLVAQSRNNRLRARPYAPVDKPAPAGLHKLELREIRDSLVYIPETAAKFEHAPLVLSLHGATQNAQRGLALLQTQADQHGFVLLAPCSESQTWEIEESWGEDLQTVDKSLALAFGLRNIDAKRISIAGFSDGASYSLALGLTNGDFFNAVMAFSPGYAMQGVRTGKPPVFISAGTADPIFPIDQAGRAITKNLKAEGYSVTLKEFDGGHRLPPDVAAAAANWLPA